MKRLFIAAASIAALGLGSPAARAAGDCGCLDLALVIDNTGSMGPAIDNIKAGLTNIISDAKLVSGDDFRIGLVTFPDDNVVVSLPLSADTNAISTAVNGIALGGGNALPESSDEALQLVVTGAADTTCAVVTNSGPFGTLRANCLKLAVLVTDAVPGGCDDAFTAGIDDVHAASVAAAAAAAGIKIVSIQVGGAGDATLTAIMQQYATTSGGLYTLVPATGVGASDAIRGIIQLCGAFTAPDTFLPSTKPATHAFDITRTARYWSTHPYSSDPACATLLEAIKASNNQLRVGFLGMPVDYRNADGVKDAADATIEALGFYFRSLARTGEPGGTQSGKLRGSALCKERKRLAQELIATIANNVLLGTGPENATYISGGVQVAFPADLIEQAGTAAAGANITTIRTMAALLRKFNNSGVTNDFVNGLIECSALDKKSLKALARDATTQNTCPGFNDSCETSTEVASFPYTQSVNLSKYKDNLSGPGCVAGGREAVWRISPPVAASGRQFVVQTAGSNFDTVISVRRGLCNVFSEVGCVDNAVGVGGEELVFTTNGTDTYFIVIEGKTGAYGKLEMRVTSF